MAEISFKERVKNVAISAAQGYKQYYIDYEYLICSEAFELKDYYIIDAEETNYQHLLGVNSPIKPKEFFDKCLNGTLQETDFNFIKNGLPENSVKGSVREKISVLHNMLLLFQSEFTVEESFSKNKLNCTFATTDNNFTLGFIDNTKSRPMSLLKGNKVDPEKSKKIDLILRKDIKNDKFDEVIIGDSSVVLKYYGKIKDHIADALIPDTLSKTEIDDVV